MAFRTRIVSLAAPRPDGDAKKNTRTHVVRIPVVRPPTDFRALFVRHYERIRETCLRFAEPGVALFACRLDDGAWAGSMCLAARAGAVRAGVVGRHSAADLHLPDDPSLALRHLAVLVEAPSLRDALRGDVRFRVLDLATGSPPRDEEGRAVESLTVEGPVFLTCQGYALLAFVTGDPTDWPASPIDAWDCIPERVFVEERLAPTAQGSGAAPLPGGAAPARDLGRQTLIRRHLSASAIVDLRHAPVEPPVGTLALMCDREVRLSVDVGREQMRRGILVGRYDRCAGGADITTDEVSRVHLLVIELGGRLYAIDLCSTNGTFLALDRPGEVRAIKVAPVEDGEVFALGSRNTAILWTVDGVPPSRTAS